jgi:hypothetical protein
MPFSIRRLKGSARWWAYVWVPHAPAVADGTQMAYEDFGSREEAERWAKRVEPDLVTRYEALCAWRAGLSCVKREWAPHYAKFAAEEADDQQQRR